MFRGQAVIIEYSCVDKGMTEIDFAYITDDNPDFIHPNYEIIDDYVDNFHREVWKLTAEHLKKIVKI